LFRFAIWISERVFVMIKMRFEALAPKIAIAALSAIVLAGCSPTANTGGSPSGFSNGTYIEPPPRQVGRGQSGGGR
jgi:hypothetical protein